MKKRIIASVLVVVMLALALVGCGSFSFSDEDLSAYVTEFDYDKFMAELKRIELEEDGDFTTDEKTRQKKVEEAIFAAMSTTVTSEADDYEFDKLETGKLGAHDVVYFCYYATDAIGNVYFYDQMKESAITSSTTKAKHNAQLGLGDYSDELIEKIVEALADYDFGVDGENVYSMLTAAYLDDTKIAEGDKIVVSYTVEYKKTVDDTENTYKESAVFEEITVSSTSENALAKKLAELAAEKDENNNDVNTVKVGTTVKVGSDKTESFKVTGADGIEYTYSSVKAEWKVEKSGTPVSFKYTPHALGDGETVETATKNEYTPDNRRSTSAGKVNLTGVELTYYVYPVYHIAIPEEITAANILRYAFGSNLKESSFELFSDEAYKNGDKTIKTLLAELADIYSETYTNDTENDESLSALKDAYEKAVKAVSDAGDSATDEQKKAVEDAYEAYIEGAKADIYDIKALYDDAAKAVKAAGDDVTEEQEQLEEDTLKAYTETMRAALSEKIDAILAAESSAEGAEDVADVVVEEYKEEQYHTLREEYDEFITEAVEQAVYELLFNNDDIIKVKAYPEKVLAEFEERILEQYKYDFYKGDYSTTQSNYNKYGTFEAFLEAKITTDGEIEDQAKEALAPILKLYAAAKVFEAKGAAFEMVDYVKDDIAAGKYDASYDEDADDETKADAEEAAKENKEAAIKNAEQFFVDDEVFKEFKKSLGSAAYRQYEEQYGEINLRASMQFNNLFYYLTSTKLEKGVDDEHPHTKYKKAADGSYVLSFRNINYTFKADDAE